jgi:excisionase family DNA binding protein
MEERHLSLSEAADALNISERTAYRWIKSGKLRAYKPGRDYWIPESAIKEVVEESVVRPKDRAAPPLEPSLLNGLEEERREYPYPWMAGSLERVIDDWRHIVEDPSKRGPAHTKEAPDYSRAIYRRAIATACFDVVASVVLIDRATHASGEEWDRLPENEKRERLQVAKEIDALARQALAQYKASEAAQEAEVLVLERRREEIRQRTAEISA